jgi:dTMP kinase
MGKFITFEGGEGCGKTTLINSLTKYFEDHKLNFVVTREPGGLPLCEEIRKILKYFKDGEIDSRTELLLFSASRATLTSQFIIPQLKSGKIVLCDRFFDSTRVYQGYCGKISDEDVMEITNFAVNNLKPDLTFYLNIDPVVAFKRKNGPDSGDRFENLSLDFHHKVREGYLHIASLEPKRFRVIDASKPANEVFDNVLEILKRERII